MSKTRRGTFSSEPLQLTMSTTLQKIKMALVDYKTLKIKKTNGKSGWNR